VPADVAWTTGMKLAITDETFGAWPLKRNLGDWDVRTWASGTARGVRAGGVWGIGRFRGAVLPCSPSPPGT